MMLTVGDGISILGLASVIIVALLRMTRTKPINSVVNKEVCNVRHQGLSDKIDGLKSDIRDVQTTLSSVQKILATFHE